MDNNKSLGRRRRAGTSNAGRARERAARPKTTAPIEFETLIKMDDKKSLGSGLRAGRSNARRGNRSAAYPRTTLVQMDNNKPMARNRRGANSKTTPGTSLTSSLRSVPLTRSGSKREKIEKNWYKATDAPKDGVPALPKKMDKKIDLDTSFEIIGGKRKKVSFASNLENQDTFASSKDDIIDFPKQRNRKKVSFASNLENQDTFASSQDDIIDFPKQRNRKKVAFACNLENQDTFGSAQDDIIDFPKQRNRNKVPIVSELENQDTFDSSQDDIIEFPKRKNRKKVPIVCELENQDTFDSSQDDIIEFPKRRNRKKVPIVSELENQDKDKYALTFKRRKTFVFSPDISFEACFGSPKHNILPNADVDDAGDINLDDSFDHPNLPLLNFDTDSSSDEDIFGEDFDLDSYKPLYEDNNSLVEWDQDIFSDNYVDQKKNRRDGFKRERIDSIFFEDDPNDEKKNQRAGFKRKRTDSFFYENDPKDQKKNLSDSFKRKRTDSLFMSLEDDPNVSLMDSQDLVPNNNEDPGTSHWSNLKSYLKRGMAFVKRKRKEMDEMLGDDGSESDFFEDDDDDSLFEDFPQDIANEIIQSIPRKERLGTRNTF